MIPRCFSIVTNNRLSALAAALSVESTGDEADGDCAFSLPAFKAEVCMEGRADSPEQASLSGVFRGFEERKLVGPSGAGVLRHGSRWTCDKSHKPPSTNRAAFGLYDFDSTSTRRLHKDTKSRRP